ncbi:DUF262 domain-containing protein [Bradyrhizobium uaiense]|uniref:DUF262 domain-containing protein n=1 Tax=Bradyrhizobium uaiense TaxID=2594946 RepID=A0A6P1BEF9_9BRAD|nr:DUF262 domain-containing HNH endonuclease family protein [Bradyrhizobium uaiense]NEU95971.1 DUF262 domain-containing protein [Bradyrhizobium uaiense]
MTDALSEAPAYGIARLLQEGRFIVPSHQRDFAWGDDDVKQLFDDVIDALSKKSESYFLGLLVFLYSGNAYTILDGQQRLATTVVIFAAKLAQSIFDGHVKTAAVAFAELKDVYPSDQDFEAAFALKSERTNQKAQYFLRALEKEEQRLAKGKMAGEWEPAVLTVEHILPKKPGADWKAILTADPEIVEDCVVRLGNMCLLTKINEKLGNKGFPTKKLTLPKANS